MKNLFVNILISLSFILLIILFFATISNNNELKNVNQSLELLVNNQITTTSEITPMIDTSWTGEDDPDYLKDETQYILSILDSKEGLTANDKFLFVGQSFDEYGYTHKRYQHYYKGVVVDGSEYLTHLKNGQLVNSDGRIFKLSDVNATPVLLENEALAKAKQYLNMKDNIITPGQLVITPVGGNYNSGEFVLSWSFHNMGNFQIYINAINGTEVNRISSIVF